MIFCIIQINGVDRYISNENLSTDMIYQWKGLITKFTPPKFTLANKHGGRVKIGFGDMEVTADLYDYPGRDTDPPLDFPPELSSYVRLWYSEISDNLFSSDCLYLFDGTAHLQNFTRDTSTYAIWDEDSDIYVLTTGTDYNGNEVDLPRAFGRYHHYSAKRMEDYSTGGNDYPAYHSGYMETGAGWIANVVSNVEDNGSGKVRFHTASAHGYTTGDIVTTEDVNFYYWDTSAVTVIDTDTFDKDGLAWVGTPTTSDYAATTVQAGLSWIQNSGHAYTPGQFRVYDGGIPITGNATRLTELDEAGRGGQFYLSYYAVGEVTVSGTGTKYGSNDFVSLKNVIDWASLSDRLNFALTEYDVSTDSVEVSWLQDSQVRALDFLDQLCASFHYWFAIVGSNVGHCRNMVQPASVVPDVVLKYYRDDYLSLNYNYDKPYRSATTSWTVRTSVEDNTGKYVSSEESTITETSANYSYGDELNITWYNQVDPSDASTVIAESLALANKPKIKVNVPLKSTTPEIGNKVRIIDHSTLYSLTTEFCVRNISYDFDNDEAEISGEGDIYLYVEGHELATNPVV